ncbi:MAG: hypothetical protein VX246_16290 [Myxococcota bacterium]|nr:hypothetical protein [Myxococcota bacterium]
MSAKEQTLAVELSHTEAASDGAHSHEAAMSGEMLRVGVPRSD